MAKLIFACTLAALAFSACGGGGESPEPTSSPVAVIDTSTPTPLATSPSPTIVPTPSATTPPDGASYTVQQGDTLYAIAQRFGTTVEAIQDANSIGDPTAIEVGQTLIIPGGEILPTATAIPQQTAAPSGGPAAVVRVGDSSRREVAFTFDAGSDAGYTAMILDVLAANGIRASFGMTGKWAETNPDLLRRIVNEGHSLINHTYDHASFTGRSTGKEPLSQSERWRQLDRTEEIILELTGATTKPYFRPPFGDFDDSVNADVGARGYGYNIMWTVDSRGWMGIPAPEISSRCIQLAEPGAIYVFHVGAASQDGPALQAMIDGLRADGYSISDVNAVLVGA